MTPAERLQQRGLLELAQEVAAEHQQPLEAVLGKSRAQSVCVARRALWYRLRHHPERCLSYPEIGRLVGRDHTTIIDGCRKHAESLPPGEAGRCAIEASLHRVRAARAAAVALLRADLLRIEAAADDLGMSLDEVRDA